MHVLRKPVQMPVPPSVTKIRHVILQTMVWQEHRLMLILGGLAWLGTNVLRSTVPPERHTVGQGRHGPRGRLSVWQVELA